MSPVPHYYLEYAAFAAFWCFVIGLDLICLWCLRRSRIEATARVLWVVWIVVAPIIGAVTYFIVQPAPDMREIRHGDGSCDVAGAQPQRWRESIQR